MCIQTTKSLRASFNGLCGDAACGWLLSAVLRAGRQLSAGTAAAAAAGGRSLEAHLSGARPWAIDRPWTERETPAFVLARISRLSLSLSLSIVSGHCPFSLSPSLHYRRTSLPPIHPPASTPHPLSLAPLASFAPLLHLCPFPSLQRNPPPRSLSFPSLPSPGHPPSPFCAQAASPADIMIAGQPFTAGSADPRASTSASESSTPPQPSSRPLYASSRYNSSSLPSITSAYPYGTMWHTQQPGGGVSTIA